MGFTEQDRKWMQRALELAEQGRGYVEPNPMVGAVLVRDGAVIGEGYHARYGGPHAEVAALFDAHAQGERPAGATLYVTLEPCTHHGKTPPCAGAVGGAGVARVVVATPDPTWQSYGEGEACRRGADALREAGVSVEFGLCREEAAVLNAAFFKRSCTGMPLVIAKWAMSLDGKIATRTGDSRWISREASRREVHRLRGIVDAVIVGSGTARRDDARLTCRDAECRRTAARVVLCGESAPGLGSVLARSAREVPVLLAHVQERPPQGLWELQQAGCEVLPLPEDAARPGWVAPRALLEALGRRGISNVLVEGGAEVLGSFFDAEAVDRVTVFVAPVILGGAEAVPAVGGRGAAGVAEGLSLVGGEPHFAGEAEVAPARSPVARLVGRDVLIEGWVCDPIGWAPPAARAK